MLRLAQCKADLLMREGRSGSAIPMCEGTNIKTPAEGLQTQDVAAHVKPVHSCAYSSAQDVPVCLGAVLRRADLLMRQGRHGPCNVVKLQLF